MMAAESQPRKTAEGLECPHCGCPESEVIETRKRLLRIDGALTGGIYRRRECEHCGMRFTTNERISGDDS